MKTERPSVPSRQRKEEIVMPATRHATLGVLVVTFALFGLPSCDFSLEDWQEFDLTRFDPPGTILDIGGGGEGVIGQLSPERVIAIDLSREELANAPGNPLKIVMDASDLKFLDSSFETATSFCTLMYIDEDIHEEVFQEMHRVLKPGGSFHIWDIVIPEKTESSKEKILIPVSVQLPEKSITTAYGVRRRDSRLDLDYYLELASEAGFKVASKESSQQSFYLDLLKPTNQVEPDVEASHAHDHHSSHSEEQRVIYEQQEILLEELETSGLILDIGGGGEGVIGRLEPHRVVAIDISRPELEGAPPGPLKIVMDAGNLKFLDESFPTVTSFFTLMYIPGSHHEKVFQEIHRVLEPQGRFLIWDVVLPTAPDEHKRLAAIPLRIRLPKEEIQTAYGVRFAEVRQDLSYYLALAKETGFEVAETEDKERVFFIELAKP
jgi:ubiquinone/menaquinone biosynthesis C-methylase UbiE